MPGAATPASPRRNFGLDLLRGVAILVVLANHAFLGFFVAQGHVSFEGTALQWSLVSFISIEWLFVLSGFLIGTMMIRSFETEPTFWGRARGFWLRRWFRTVPNYYLFLAVNAAIAWGGWYGTLAVGTPSWTHAVFSQNLVRPETVPFFFTEAWSLALDEWFYLVLPVLIGLAAWALRRGLRNAALVATAALILAPTLARLVVPIAADPFEWDHAIRRVTVFHLDATGWGVLAAITSRWWPQAWQARTGWTAAAGVALMAFGVLSLQAMFAVPVGPLGFLSAWPRIPFAFALTSMGLGTVLALPAICRLRPPHARAAAGVEALSNYSYSIYLSHFPLMCLLSEAIAPQASLLPLPLPFLGWVTAAWLALTLLVSMVVHHAFEKPLSDLRERFTRKVDANPFGPSAG